MLPSSVIYTGYLKIETSSKTIEGLEMSKWIHIEKLYDAEV